MNPPKSVPPPAPKAIPQEDTNRYFIQRFCKDDKGWLVGTHRDRIMTPVEVLFNLEATMADSKPGEMIVIWVNDKGEK